MSTTSTTDAGPRVLLRPRPLRIGMVAPPYYSVPPKGYGGVEAVVAGLVDRLVARGHHITLFAAGPRGTAAQEFVRTWEIPPVDQLTLALPEVVHAARVEALLREHTFDIIHDHTLAGPLTADARRSPTVVTVHGSMDDLAEVYRPLGDTVSLVALSNSQRGRAPDLNWVGTVHNGVDVDSFPYRAEKDDYVLFLGRFHPQKAPHLAIEAARRAGVRIILAGKCSEEVEHEYYREHLAPLLGPDAVEVGVADQALKRRLLSGARCLVFPICWEEPFGLVMVEAMACGTPVVALARGAALEVVSHGRTGFVVDRPEQLADAIADCAALDPADCRRYASGRFSLDAMAAGYESVYRRVLARAGTGSPSSARMAQSATGT